MWSPRYSLNDPVASKLRTHLREMMYKDRVWAGYRDSNRANRFPSQNFTRIFTMELLDVCDPGITDIISGYDIHSTKNGLLQIAGVGQWNPPSNLGRPLWTAKLSNIQKRRCVHSALSIMKRIVCTLRTQIHPLAVRGENQLDWGFEMPDFTLGLSISEWLDWRDGSKPWTKVSLSERKSPPRKYTTWEAPWCRIQLWECFRDKSKAKNTVSWREVQ